MNPVLLVLLLGNEIQRLLVNKIIENIAHHGVLQMNTTPNPHLLGETIEDKGQDRANDTDDRDRVNADAVEIQNAAAEGGEETSNRNNHQHTRNNHERREVPAKRFQDHGDSLSVLDDVTGTKEGESDHKEDRVHRKHAFSAT